MSARIYSFEIGAKMKPPRLPATDLVEVNVQITEIQVTLEQTQETCVRISHEIDKTNVKIDHVHDKLDKKIDDVHDKLDKKIDDVHDKLDKKIDDVHDKLDRKIDDVHDKLDRKIDDVHEKLDRKIDDVHDKLDQKIDRTHAEQRQDMEKMQLHFDGKFSELSHQFEQLRADVKNIISWKDRAVGVILALSTLCTLGVSLALAAKTFF